MPKYLISASYTAEGLRGLQRDKASGRRRAVATAVEGVGGKVECFYNALGPDDAYVIVDLPDNVDRRRAGNRGISGGTGAHPDDGVADRRGSRPSPRQEHQLPRPRRITTRRRGCKQRSEGCARLQPVAHDLFAGGEPDAVMRADVF